MGRRPNPKALEQELIRRAHANVWGSLGTRLTGLTRHISLTGSMRAHVANFDNFHEEVQETFLAYLYTRYDNGNHVH